MFEKRVVTVYMCDHYIHVSELFWYGSHREFVCDCIIIVEILYVQLFCV